MGYALQWIYDLFIVSHSQFLDLSMIIHVAIAFFQKFTSNYFFLLSLIIFNINFIGVIFITIIIFTIIIIIISHLIKVSIFQDSLFSISLALLQWFWLNHGFTLLFVMLALSKSLLCISNVYHFFVERTLLWLRYTKKFFVWCTHALIEVAFYWFCFLMTGSRHVWNTAEINEEKHIKKDLSSARILNFFRYHETF